MCEWDDTVTTRFNGGLVDVDRCIMPLVRALNYGGIRTVASCCGHGRRPGNISLADGRELVICPDHASGRKVDAMLPPIHEEETNG